MRKFLYILIGLVVVLAAVVLIGPSLVDWNAYKDRIAEEIHKQTGRAFSIEGDMSLALLPVPALSASRVSLANIEGGSPEPMLALKALRVRVALFPLLKGKIQIERVSLVEPRILLEVLPDGQRNWEFGGAKAGASTGASGGASGGGRTGAPGMNIQLDDFSVEDGTLVYRDSAAGREERVEALNARIVAGSLRGPFEAKGDARLRAIDLSFEATLGRLVDDGATPIGLLVQLVGRKAQAQFSGALSIHPETVLLHGRFKVEGEDLAAAAAAFSTRLPASLAREFVAKGEISIDREALDLSELEFRLDDTEVAGRLTARLAAPYDARLVLAARRIDLDRLLGPAGGQAGDRREGAGGAGTPPAAADGAWTLPKEVTARVELTADALAYRGQVARQLRVDAALADGRLTFERAEALLPGSSNLSLVGVLAGSDKGPRFTGQITASSDNLRGLLRWFEADLAAVPADRLRRLSLKTRIDATRQQIAVSDIDLQVDLSHITGGVIVAPRARPGLGIGLVVDSINLDAYLPQAGTGTGAGQANGEAQETQGAQETPAESGLAVLDLFDANLNLRVGALTLRDTTAKDLRVEATLQRGALEFRTARIGDLTGSTASYTGRVENLAAAPGLDGTLELEVAEPARLARLLGVRPEDLKRMPPFGAHVTLLGDLEKLAVDGRLTAFGGQFEMVGTVGPAATPPSFDLRLTARHPEVVGLAEALVGPLPLEPGLGGIDLTGRLAGTAERIAVSELSGRAGPAELSGRFDLDLAGAAPQVSGLDLAVAVQHENLAALATGLGLPGFRGPGIGGPGIGGVDSRGRVTGSLDNLRVEALSGTLGPARISGSLGLDLSGEAAGLRDLDLAVSVAHPDLAGLAAALGGPDDLPPGLGAVDLAGRLRGSGQTIRLEQLAGQLGPTRLSGELAADFGGPRPAITANLQMGTLPLEVWLGSGSGGGTGDAGGSGEGERWSRAPMDLSGLRGLDADLDLKAEALTHDALRIDGASLEARLENGILDVRRFTGTLYGGALQVSGRLDARGTPEAAFAVTALEVDLGALLRDRADFDRISGPVSLNADLTTRGRSEAELVSALAGRGNLSGRLTARAKTGEKVGSLLLGILGTRIAQVRGIADASGLLLNAFADAPATLKGSFTVERGVVTTRDTRLDGRSAYAVTRGSADLPAWRLDSLTEVYQPRAPQSPELTVRLRGPLDAPDVKVGGQALRLPTAPAVEPLAPSGPQPSSPQPTSPAPSQTQPPGPTPLEPKKFLKGLLKGLGG